MDPKAQGAFFIRKGTKIQPIVHEGGQEKELRSGSENVANIVGMGKAADMAKAEMEGEGKLISAADSQGALLLTCVLILEKNLEKMEVEIYDKMGMWCL